MSVLHIEIRKDKEMPGYYLAECLEASWRAWGKTPEKAMKRLRNDLRTTQRNGRDLAPVAAYRWRLLQWLSGFSWQHRKRRQGHDGLTVIRKVWTVI